MVALTTLTLWSLGQALVVAPEEGVRSPSAPRTATAAVTQTGTATRG